MADIFLSYSRDDLATARRFASAFEREGLSVWWDQTLNPGEAFDEVTERALEEARAVVVLWSKHSVDSRWVRAEATQANSNGTLVPVMIGPCKRPIMFELTQTADLSRWKGNAKDPAWQSFLASVQRQTGTTDPVTSAREIESQSTGSRNRLGPATIAVALAAVLLAVGGGLWALTRHPGNSAQTHPDGQGALPADAGEAAQEVTLAILPFVNMSSDPEQEYFSDGLTEEILNQLTQFKDLRVIGRTSSFSFKGKDEDPREVGAKLGATNLLEGNVRKSGESLRITAKLIRSKDGTQLWSETYARQLVDIFDVQEDIAKSVAAALHVALAPGQSGTATGGTTNLKAYDLYLLARSIARNGNFQGSATTTAALEQAVALDPDFSNAWALLSSTYVSSWDNPAPLPYDEAELHRRTSVALVHALELAPNSPLTLIAAGMASMRDREWLESERRFRRALEIAPEDYDSNFIFAWFLTTVGRAKDSVAFYERARRKEPLVAQPSFMLTEVYSAMSDDENLEKELDTLRSLGGETGAIYGFALMRALAKRDRPVLEQLLANDSSAEGAKLRHGLADPSFALVQLRELYEDPANRGRVFPMSIVAHWATFFGDEKLALQALGDLGPSLDIFVIWRPDLAPVRRLPEFKDIVRDLGLVDYWRATGNWGEFCKPVGKDDFECH